MKKQYPAEFKDSINQLLGEDAPRFWEALGESPKRGLRLNPQKTNLEELEAALPGAYSPLPWSETGFEVKADDLLGNHPYHAAGLFYLQEPSAMAPVAILDPLPGERVLDLCGAPGGKTTQIQARMKNKGVLIANDPNPRRVQALARNIERWGATNTAILCETPQRLSEHFGSYFDRVLVDAPCSGEGTFRSNPSEIKKWSPAFRNRCRTLQDEILWYAGKLVRPGGVLVYSTCTFNQIENEGSVAHFLDKNPDFQLDSISRLKGYSPGIQLEKAGGIDYSIAVRIWPHNSLGEGHFIARLRNTSQVEVASHSNSGQEACLEPPHKIAYEDFFIHTLRNTEFTQPFHPTNQGVCSFGNRLYWIPIVFPSLKGLNVVHWGFWLGTILANGFNPGPALASALNTGDVQKVLEFALEDPRLDSYRRGSPVAIGNLEQHPDSWALITVSGHPLGWGKIQNGRIKSHFPRWLRLS